MFFNGEIFFSKEFEENGFRKRTRPVLIPPSEYGVQCPSLNEVQPCQNPQCYVWDFDQWGSCMLDDPSEKCGTGQRNRQVYCTTHDKVIIAICDVNYLHSVVNTARGAIFFFLNRKTISITLSIETNNLKAKDDSTIFELSLKEENS